MAEALCADQSAVHEPVSRSTADSQMPGTRSVPQPRRLSPLRQSKPRPSPRTSYSPAENLLAKAVHLAVKPITLILLSNAALWSCICHGAFSVAPIIFPIALITVAVSVSVGTSPVHLPCVHNERWVRRSSNVEKWWVMLGAALRYSPRGSRTRFEFSPCTQLLTELNVTQVSKYARSA